MKNLCVLIALVGIVNAIPSETDGLLTSALKMIKECGDNSMFLCMKVSLWAWSGICDDKLNPKFFK